MAKSNVQEQHAAKLAHQLNMVQGRHSTTAAQMRVALDKLGLKLSIYVPGKGKPGHG